MQAYHFDAVGFSKRRGCSIGQPLFVLYTGKTELQINFIRSFGKR
jgi:hypothetical protein